MRDFVVGSCDSMMAPNLRNFVDIGRKIVCVGLNFREHAYSMKFDLPTKPVLFMKPTSSYIRAGESLIFPPDCHDLYPGSELGVVIGDSKVKNIPENVAMDAVAGYCLALDVAARDIMQECKERGLPWEISKGFDTSCPVGDFIPAGDVGDPHKLELWFQINDRKRLSGFTKDFIFTIPTLISYASKYFTLEMGDLILTGSPHGVQSVKPGDVIRSGLVDLSSEKPVTLAEIRFKVGGSRECKEG